MYHTLIMHIIRRSIYIEPMDYITYVDINVNKQLVGHYHL